VTGDPHIAGFGVTEKLAAGGCDGVGLGVGLGVADGVGLGVGVAAAQAEVLVEPVANARLDSLPAASNAVRPTS